jgi:hypothetical protein
MSETRRAATILGCEHRKRSELLFAAQAGGFGER